MKGSADDDLKQSIKQMISIESDRGIDPNTISDDEPLFGEASCVQLDSLDILQLSMAIYKTYGLKITDSKDARRVFVTVNNLADEIQPE